MNKEKESDSRWLMLLYDQATKAHSGMEGMFERNPCFDHAPGKNGAFIGNTYELTAKSLKDCKRDLESAMVQLSCFRENLRKKLIELMDGEDANEDTL